MQEVNGRKEEVKGNKRGRRKEERGLGSDWRKKDVKKEDREKD